LTVLLIHLFTCFFYLAGSLNPSGNSWIEAAEIQDDTVSMRYVETLYWNLQTLTTVGYGNFSITTTQEIVVTMIWILIGVAYQSILVGSLTSGVTEVYDEKRAHESYLTALDNFAEKHDFDKVTLANIRDFIYNNFKEMNERADQDAMIGELPAQLKEQVLNHQYGTIVKKFDLFRNSNYSKFVWGFVSKFQFIRLEAGNPIYEDNYLATKMYFIEEGLVRLYAENNITFWSFRQGQNFGEVDIFCN